MFLGCPNHGQALRLPERTPSFLQGGHTVRKVQMVTDRELEILKILWSRGQASVREVQEDLIKSAGPVAYSTVQTLLNIMEEKKGLVRHTVEGRTFIYSPKKPAERTIRELTRRFVDRVFDGALDRVLVALLDAQSPNANELEKLRGMIDQARRQADAPRPVTTEDL
jgi:BlaI family penicillinase repressor